jgi:hypothetical protein
MNNQSALTESVSKNNDQKQIKAKQIFLGIDAHLKSNQVAWRATLRLAHTSSRYRFNNVCRPTLGVFRTSVRGSAGASGACLYDFGSGLPNKPEESSRLSTN